MDILKVLKQYEYKHKNFKFIGPSPIDFDKRKEYNQCVWNELCNFNLSEILKTKKNEIGFIFNLDPHNRSGSHWISMYLSLKRNFLFFNDSTGSKPPIQIKRLIARILSQAKSLNINLNYTNNTLKHQRKNTECGVYTIYFITELLNGKLPEDFNILLDDKFMEQYRNIFFNINV